ncbi:MAG: hypothetical protein K2X44_04030, partial [Magnetospirillum sp.]|nr:hypothetical protein [Magnetospirillum sp.]
SLLQRVTKAAQQAKDADRRLLVEMDPPWVGFVDDVAAAAQAMVVSYKPDTGWQGALHNDTAYGPIDAGKKEPNTVVRRPLLTLAGWKAKDASDSVRDPILAAKVVQVLSDHSTEPARKAELSALTHCGQPVRRVRTMERLEGVQTITDRRTGLPYKLVKRDGNHRTEIWRLPDGSLEMTIVSTFDAAAEALGRPQADRRPHPAAKFLMKLHKNDMVAFGVGAERQIFRVVKMSDGRVMLAGHTEGGDLKKRNGDKDDPFKYINGSLTRLKAEQARKIHVSPGGRVFDPGPIL